VTDHCCTTMRRAVAGQWTAEERAIIEQARSELGLPSRPIGNPPQRIRFDPDVPGMGPIYSMGSPSGDLAIAFCPWCGTRLPYPAPDI
jgi:hypothetical protein